MRARFINEEFIEDSDPIKDMGIGWNLDKYIEKKEKQLEYEAGSFYETLIHAMRSNPVRLYDDFMFMLSKMPMEYQKEFIDDFFIDEMYEMYKIDMKAEFVNEKFIDDSDPIKDMGIGWNINKYIDKCLEDYNNKHYKKGFYSSEDLREKFKKTFNKRAKYFPEGAYETIMLLSQTAPIEYQKDWVDSIMEWFGNYS